MLLARPGGTCVLLLLLATCVRTGVAQVTTGSLQGTVRDDTGSVLVAAAVTLSSNALIGGPMTRTTNEKGQYRFHNLPPGRYRMEVDFAGFDPFVQQDLRIGVGVTVEQHVTLSLAGVTAVVSVTDDPPLVDPRNAGLSTNVGPEILENTPTQRFSMYDMIKASPGVSATSPTSRSQTGISVVGAGVNETTLLLDGTDISSPRYGLFLARSDTDSIEEIEIQSIGASAEYGNLQGGVVNVVTRQGGNRFAFDASYYGQFGALTSQPIVLNCGACPDGQSGFERDLYRDFSAHAGGPILRDRLWFYGGFFSQRDTLSQPGADPRFPGEDKRDGFSGKITWQILPGLDFQASFQDDIWSFPSSTPSATVPFESTSLRSGDARGATFARLTHVVSDDTFWEARSSAHRYTSGLTPNGDPAEPARLDIATGVFSGGALFAGDTLERRTVASGKISHYATDFLSSDHQFKFGVQFSVAKTEGYYAYPGGVHYLDNRGEPFFAGFRDLYSYGGGFDTFGVFVEDTVRVGESLTLDLGLRFDHSDAESPEVPKRDENGAVMGTIPGRGHLYSWNVLSPRLGFTWKLTDDGKTLLRAFYGRFHQGVLTTELQSVHPGLTPTTVAFYDGATGGYTNVVEVIDPLTDVGIDPETETTRTIQFSIGIERELSQNLVVEASYVKKDGGRFTGWLDTGGLYGIAAATLPDGRTIEVFPLLNDPSERFFLLTTRDDYFFDYDGFLLSLRKRWSRRWQSTASYAYSEARGLQSQNGASAGQSQGSLTTSFNPFGRDPNDLIDATGKLANDRTHLFRMQGTVAIPKADILLGAHFQYLSGKPWTAIANVGLPQGVRPVNLEPRGSRRISSQTLFDLRVSKVFRFGSASRVELLVDILNLLNDTAEEEIITADFFSPNFGKGSTFIAPRRAMIGIKLFF